MVAVVAYLGLTHSSHAAMSGNKVEAVASLIFKQIFQKSTNF